MYRSALGLSAAMVAARGINEANNLASQKLDVAVYSTANPVRIRVTLQLSSGPVDLTPAEQKEILKGWFLPSGCADSESDLPAWLVKAR